MKNIGKIMIAAALSLSMAGCASKIERISEKEEFTIDEAIDTAELEVVINDAVVFDNVLSTFFDINEEIHNDESLSTDEKAVESAANYSAYLTKVDEIARNRVMTDIDNVDYVSDSFLSYLAMLQSYIEAFEENIEYYRTHTSADKDYMNNDLILAVSDVENFYVDVISSISE